MKLSRRSFLKLSGAGLASLACASQGFPPSTAAPALTPGPTLTARQAAAASPSPAAAAASAPAALQMNADGVIYSGPFLQVPNGLGGVAVLRNLATTLAYGGFQCSWNGWTPHRALEDQTSSVANGVLSFDGRLPGSSLWYRQRVSVQGGAVAFSLQLQGPLSQLDWAIFSFSLPTVVYKNQPYRAGAQNGVYPPSLPAEPLLVEGVNHFEVRTDDPTWRYQFDTPGSLALMDGRTWNGFVYQLSVGIPLDTGLASFTLTPPAADPGPNPPALRYSRLGYPLVASGQYAVLEIDWRAAWPDLNVRLERELPGGGAETMRAGQFTPILEDNWKRFALFDFSPVQTPGRYRLAWAGGLTGWFPISNEVYAGLWQPTLDHFLPYQMCHLAVDLGDGLRAHAACHLDDGIQAQADTPGPDGFVSYEGTAGPGPGQPIPAAVGGWHDAGDFDLNVSAQAFVTHLLALAWEQFAPWRDLNRLDLAGRQLHTGQSNARSDLLEQVEWGARWLLSMQQPNGHVYVGLVEKLGVWGQAQLPELITDGQPGTGDERQVYVDLHSDVLLKFVIAAAAASRALRSHDPALSAQCWQAALQTWDCFNANPHVYRPTVYFSDWAQGEQHMILAAAAELYLTHPDPAYLAVIAAYQSYLQTWPPEWPEPDGTWHGNFWYAPPFLARLLPRLSPGSLKTAIASALAGVASNLKTTLQARPFPTQYWDFSEWGSVDVFQARLYDAYWLSQAVPASLAFQDALPCAHWLFGLHPVNDLSLVLGLGLPQPSYLYSATLLVRLGETPASVPGAVLPGLSRYDRGGVLDYRDWPQEFYNNEACIYSAAFYIFNTLALHTHLAGYQSFLPLVSKS